MLLFGLLSGGVAYTLIYIAAILVALTIHEFAHAWAATQLGDPTAKLEGRLSLNPLAHLDPFGTLFLLLVGFGWGKPVPIDPRYFKRKSDEIVVALAGILCNFILAAATVIPLRMILANEQGITSSPLILFLALLFLINIILGVFNLLPIPPLDGSHVVEYFLSDEAKMQYQLIGPYLLIGFLLFDRFSTSSILLSVVIPVIRTIGGDRVLGLFF